MPLFCRKRTIDVQSFVLKIINNDCRELEATIEGPRTETRARVCVVVVVVPVENGEPLLDEAFSGVTKELSSTGLALILPEPKTPDHLIVGFRYENEMHFVRGKTRHLNPMGGGFYQLGIELIELVENGDYPSLASLGF
jgi:hypothetical protein